MNEVELIKILEEMKERLLKLEQRPSVEHFYNVSKDGQYIIHGTKMVDIKPRSYMEKVMLPKEIAPGIDEVQTKQTLTTLEFNKKDGTKVEFAATQVERKDTTPIVSEEKVE